MKVVPILLPVALGQLYHYAVPEGMAVQAGDVVQVPFGKSTALGCVWDDDATPMPDIAKIKPILAMVRPHIFTHAALQTIDWMAHYTLAPRGLFLRMGLKDEYLAMPKRRVAKKADENAVTASAERLALNTDQIHAITALNTAQDEEKFMPFLLDGVTGSGKTEVYCAAIAHILAQGGQALVMLPEIALTHSMLTRFAQRFSEQVHVWHSQRTPAQRRTTWQHVADGKPCIILGARSALFLPFQQLRLLVVDEEHDTSYKQEEALCHNARDMAIVRARFERCPVVLASATPSLETYHNAITGKYQWLKLNARATGVAMPAVELLDMRQFKLPKGQWIAPPLLEALTQNFHAGAQSLLFLNRRGYAPLIVCRPCGHKMECPSCTSWLVEHRRKGALACHHCGFEMPMPQRCPSCLAEADFVACGPGVERIYEEIKDKLPDARCVMISSDTAAQQEVLAKIAAKKCDIVVGTQIMAKGHDFPHLAFVGVVDGDLGLSTIDLRAAERTFQVLQQVTGRAGRHKDEKYPSPLTGEGAPLGADEGEITHSQVHPHPSLRDTLSRQGRGEVCIGAMIQTYVPDHPLMQAIAAHDRDAFYAAELAHRQRGMWPPFGRLALVMISTPRTLSPMPCAKALLEAAPHMENIRILGPAEPTLAILRDRKRLMLTLHCAKNVDLSGYISAWLAAAPKFPHHTHVRVDMDPLSFG